MGVDILSWLRIGEKLKQPVGTKRGMCAYQCQAAAFRFVSPRGDARLVIIFKSP